MTLPHTQKYHSAQCTSNTSTHIFITDLTQILPNLRSCENTPNTMRKYFPIQWYSRCRGEKFGRVGNGSRWKRDYRAYFVPGRDFPTPTRPWSLFPSRLFPIHPAVRCILDFSRRAVHPVATMPSRRLSILSRLAPQCSGRCSHLICHRLYLFPIV